VRILDRYDRVFDTRFCLPLPSGDVGHAPVLDLLEPRAVSWVVIGIPNDVVAALDEGRPSPYGFQAKIGSEWLSLDLRDTGCRLGRANTTFAAS
jgi:hypothetical protein